jgi:flagellar basal-body rod protein FlgC
MSLLSTMDISASGLNCERLRMAIIAQNVANMETTETDGGGPYKRKVAVFKETLQRQINSNTTNANFTGGGVKIANIVEDTTLPLRVYQPGHPHADKDGFLLKPNLNLADEIVDSITASRGYAANVTVLNATKSLALKALSIGRG